VARLDVGATSSPPPPILHHQATWGQSQGAVLYYTSFVIRYIKPQGAVCTHSSAGTWFEVLGLCKHQETRLDIHFPWADKLKKSFSRLWFYSNIVIKLTQGLPHLEPPLTRFDTRWPALISRTLCPVWVRSEVTQPRLMAPQTFTTTSFPGIYPIKSDYLMPRYIPSSLSLHAGSLQCIGTCNFLWQPQVWTETSSPTCGVYCFS